MNPSRRFLFYTVMVVGALAVTFAIGEVAVRAAGHEPWYSFNWYLGVLKEPIFHEPDPELGWIAKEGRYTMPPYDRDQEGPPIVITIWPGGMRATAEKRVPRSDRIVFIGGSFTQGFAVSDYETFPYRLQQQLQHTEVLNMGTAGYGTYQSLLRLQRYFDEGGVAPIYVVYGFMDDHEGRNVGAQYYLRALAMQSRRGGVAVPRCEMEAGEVVCHPPQSYMVWPGAGLSALIAFLQDRTAQLTMADRDGQRREVTEQLILRLARYVEEKGSKFMMMLLQIEPENRVRYLRFLQANGIEYVDCVDPKYGTPEMTVRGETHPNGKMHAVWTACVAPPLVRSALQHAARAGGA